MKTTPALQPLTIDTAPEGSRAALEGIQKGFGFIPNLMGIFDDCIVAIRFYAATQCFTSIDFVSIP